MGATRYQVGAEHYARTQTEGQFQRAVLDCAAHYGWLALHIRNMLGNPSGFPDLVLFRGRRAVVAELRRENGALGPKQEEWIARLAEHGVEVYVWRPSDWEAIERALSPGEPGPL